MASKPVSKEVEIVKVEKQHGNLYECDNCGAESFVESKTKSCYAPLPKMWAEIMVTFAGESGKIIHLCPACKAPHTGDILALLEV